MSVFVPILGLYVTSQDDCILWGGGSAGKRAENEEKKKRGVVEWQGAQKRARGWNSDGCLRVFTCRVI